MGILVLVIVDLRCAVLFIVKWRVCVDIMHEGPNCDVCVTIFVLSYK